MSTPLKSSNFFQMMRSIRNGDLPRYQGNAGRALNFYSTDTSQSAADKLHIAHKHPVPQPNLNKTIPLIFVRHGQSTWNQQNIFIGMTDTPLTPDGIEEAKIAGQLLAKDPRVSSLDVVYSSLLRRATKTAWIVLEELGWEWVKQKKDWRLNERNYGALVGRNKKQCVEHYGKDVVKKWRRSWDIPPPPMTSDHEYHPSKDVRYARLGIDINSLPASESLKDVTRRTSSFWDEEVKPLLMQKKRVMIVGHENNLRSLIKRLDNISDDDILHIELPRAVPLLYEIDPDTLMPVKIPDASPGLSGRYIFDKKKLEVIAERDQKQVYDLRIKKTMETVNHYIWPGES